MLLENQEKKVDLTKIEAMQARTTLSLINQFLIRTTTHVNKMAAEIEEKLQKMNQRLNDVETMVTLLEYKMNSLPPDIFKEESVPVRAPEAPPAPGPVPVSQPQQADAQPEPEAEQQNDDNDPDKEAYSKYVRMYMMGVPLASVKQKIILDGFGLDPEKVEKYIDVNAPRKVY
eukprot:TRINITY_DN503_c0_g2_i1.p1 TRINITY_DN503_c0_g2~~TRINITY_DN503_c0_g2_i1.p1  ORF type:complete len:173 (-),score=54.21 TRINITY_DN503_c0_g2_i1:180-698(-)